MAPSSTHDKPSSVDETKSSRTPDEIVVDWDGPNDPENPRNWTRRQKWTATLIMSLFTFVSPVSSSMIAPAASAMAADFGMTSELMISMSISIFVLAYAVGPLILGPLSEIIGRVKVLQFGNLFFFAWNLACGFSQNQNQMIAFRFLSGFGGSAPMSTGGGMIGDIWSAEERGGAVGIYSACALLGPAIGPVVGGWIAEKTTWRWVFYCTSIFDVVVQVMGMFLMHETYAPVLLARKAKSIRKTMDVEKGDCPVRTVHEKSGKKSVKDLYAHAIIRPFVIFGSEPIAQVIGAYMAFVYGLYYIFMTTIPTIFRDIYNESPGIAGLNYIALGLGLVSASLLNARTVNKIYIYLKNKNGGVGEPEFRVPAMVPGCIVLPIGLLITGWCADKHGHWIGVDIGLGLVTGSMVLVFQAMQIYVVDYFAMYAASALAAVSCFRSLAGFSFPLFAPAMFNALGYGKGMTLLAGISIAIGWPAPFIFWRYGKAIRQRSKHAKKPDSAPIAEPK